ncbi:hypothetical protein CI102_9853 [Trichoderma harzianum]|uniref:Uncharacterized protein n=1 Tax=Trichoderma harzianum CBS 226.95 TaxID=983964 RepID=A0A2T4AMX7_TRIHA|nr:hypothetical protein M431DRAFT_505928 [Trichoderma harzianum CBS 226.95]PKK47522.1 hypothetical protein CI102_9853 [Trichoderma harzianum]PTB58426.1 hypothetical protein M431DRAFT_505928 [Trichoderma harzianum CBS 226.95]
MGLPSLLLFWPLALLCLSGVLANQDSSKYELILYWRLRQFMIDAVGEKENVVVPLCESPCDFKDFMKAVTVKRKGPKLKEPDGITNRKDAKGRTLYQWYPDYDKDFSVFTDDLFSDPEEATKKLDDVQFTGQFKKRTQFEGADSFDDIVSSITDVIKKFQAALVADGRDPNGGWFNEIKNLISIAANGRRYNRAIHLTQEFRDWLDENPTLRSVNVQMTGLIHRAPDFDYRKVDLHATYDANRAVVGIEEWETPIKIFAVIQNSKGSALGHVNCIRLLEKLEKRLNAGCK